MHRPSNAFFTLAALASLGAALAGCEGASSPSSSRPEKAEVWFRRAGREYKEADFEEAHDSAQKALAIVPEDPDVRLWLVLECLTLPVLRRLQVAEPCVTLAGLAAFVARSGCTLDELRFTDATLEEEAVREVLPSVGEISMDRQITLQSWDR